MNVDFPLFFESTARAGKRWMYRDRVVVFALILLAVIAMPCLLASIVAPYDPWELFGMVTLAGAPPSRLHLLGTDHLSRDVLTRLLYGGRLSLSVALFATLVSVTVGTAYGAITGFAGGFTATVLERILDALLAIPRLLILIAIFYAWPGVSQPRFIVILGLTGWYTLARLVRGQVLALKTQDFVASARALGATRTRILVRHILPNVVTPVVVAATLGLGHVIILEAGLSWLGVGLATPTPSWGNMIQDGTALGEFPAHWWIAFFPALAIILTVMAFNVLGDGLLRALSPRQLKSR